jgi:protein O-mannosyl-transferase
MTTASTVAAATTRHRYAALLLLCLTAAAVYLNALSNGFALDDVFIIRENARVHDLSDLRAIWLTPYWPFFGVELGLWRPFAIFGYALQWAAGGGDPAVFHAVSIGLHVVATVLCFLLLERLTATWPALAGALVFAVHPVHTEAVANVVGQAELIAAAALIGACVVHAYRPPGLHVSWGRRAALLALFAVAILTKEHTVVLPALLLATDLAQRRIPLDGRGFLHYTQALFVPMLLLGAVLAVYLIFRYDVLDGALLGVQAGPQLHFLREEYRVLNALRAFPELLRLLVFPASLSADYAPAMILPVESFTPMVGVGAALLIATVALALLTPWNPAVGFPAAWFLIGIITVSNLLFPIGVIVAERTLYMPSLAVSAIVAYGWLALAPRLTPQARRLAPVLLLLVVIAGGVRTWVRNPDWRSTRPCSSPYCAIIRGRTRHSGRMPPGSGSSVTSMSHVSTSNWRCGSTHATHSCCRRPATSCLLRANPAARSDCWRRRMRCTPSCRVPRSSSRRRTSQTPGTRMRCASPTAPTASTSASQCPCPSAPLHTTASATCHRP